MKLFRNIAKAVLAVSMLSVMVACEEEAEYTPAQNLTNAQVYFSNTTAKDVKIGMQDTELNVAICRANTNGDLDVKLVKTGSELMNVPSSVKFANGDSVANIKVTFDPEAIGYDNPQTINIALADSATLATPYGESVFSLTAMIPSPWTSLGKATITDDILSALFNTGNPVFQCEIQENDLVPGYYRLVNPYTSSYPLNSDGDYDTSKDYYLYIHAENPNQVYYGMTELGVDWGYGMMFTTSYAGYYLENGKTEEDVTAAGLWGTLKDGEITFPVKGLLFGMADYNDGGMYYGNGSGLFSILLPGYVKADYSAEVKYAGIFTAADETVSAVANLTLGADATDVKAIVMTQADDAAAVADALAAGELEGTPVQAGRIEVPFNAEELGSEKLQVIVAVIVDGAVKNVASSGFEYYGGGSNPWKSLGMGTYTESILCSVFKLDAVTYEIEILENTETPGLYRLMNVYANSTYPYAEDDCAAEGTYLEVNACDPEGVYVPQQSLGIDWGYGDISFVSGGANYLSNYDFETIKNAGYFGTLKDGVITLPNMKWEMSDGSFREGQGLVYMGTGLYGFGTLDGFRVTLPGAAAEAPKYARSQFVKNLERTFIGKKFAPVVNKRMVKRLAKPAL